MLDQAPDDVEEVLIAWLGSLYRTSIIKRNQDPFPFILVRHIDGHEEAECGTADHLVEVRVLCDRSFGEDAVADICSEVNRQMGELAIDLPDVYLPKRDRNASIDYVTCPKSFRWLEYENDQILCKRANYEIGLSYNSV